MLSSNERIRLKRLESRRAHLEKRIKYVNLGIQQQRPDHYHVEAEEVALRWAIRYIKEAAGEAQSPPDEEEREWRGES